MLLRRLGGLSVAVSGHLRRGLSTGAAASRPPWAMVHLAMVLRSPNMRAELALAEPPRSSHIVVPSHLLDLEPRPASDSDMISHFTVKVRAVSGDGFLLLDFRDWGYTAHIVACDGIPQTRRSTGFNGKDPGAMRFVCNPLNGQLFRLPDIDGTDNTSGCKSLGLLTHSERPHGPPDRYAVAELVEDDRGVERRFLMRRFLSPKGEWDKLVGLPSPLPVARRAHDDHDHEVLAFAGRLWWVDVSWGAITADPFSDRPEPRFVELPRGSVTEAVQGIDLDRKLSRYRRMGVSEGRLHYAEVTQEEPYLLSSFALDDDGSWTLMHRVALTRLWAHPSDLCEEDSPRIGVIDPLNASIMHLTVGNKAFSVDMIRRKVITCCVLGEGDGLSKHFTGFLKPCVLPPWLGSCQIPSAGTLSSTKGNVKHKTLADVLVRHRQ